ncbi:MAG: NmrA family NAD(P)-binding protein [Chloroflexota bacterium]
MRILVIGATGMLGAPVAQALQAAGHSVRVLSRDPQKARAPTTITLPMIWRLFTRASAPCWMPVYRHFM